METDILLLSFCDRRAATSNRRSEKNVQQRRPPPAADAGRSCWGSGLQDASAAQGTRQTQGAATRRLPRLESSGDLAALNTRHLLRKPVYGLKAPLGLSCPAGTAVLSGSLLARKRERNPAAMSFAKGAKFQTRDYALRGKHLPQTKRKSGDSCRLSHRFSCPLRGRQGK